MSARPAGASGMRPRHRAEQARHGRKLGLPLVVLYGVVAVALVPLIWQF